MGRSGVSGYGQTGAHLGDGEAVNLLIAADGTIKNITVISGHPLLVPAAMEAVRQWQYAPTTLNGQPVEVVTEAEVNFPLN